MHFSIARLAIVVTLLTACTTTIGPIVPTGKPDQYTLTNRSSNPLTSWVQLKSDALMQAQEYCQSLNKKMAQPTVASNHATGLSWPIAYVTFSCVPLPASSDSKPVLSF